ncbi:hypothetical protein ENSA5_13580 [Enhygromyxa salina]|uniref:Uncharacterized protein n=1 Tax=Enhygromyxa salina TaxID=215803 RepID=A0A2S9YEY0_9BACT|nr:hypothetical protein [Enhygromyxa salina]PRQ03665.1 hypothetical protein ENSA5_13580 [Enhygromyxa salina]
MDTEDQDRSPSTVKQVVDRARRLHAKPEGLLVFGDDVDAGVEGLAADAGPPKKILEHLNVLAELAQALRQGPLGTTRVQWLKNRNVNASDESESTSTSASEMRQRVWHDGQYRRKFTLHTKPNDGTRTSWCVRIYFDWDPDKEVIIVAWIGRHP